MHINICNVREKAQYPGPSFYLKRKLCKIRSRYATYGFMPCDMKEKR